MVQRIEPGPGQESVWDYPRPPRLEPSPRRIRILFNGVTLADSTQTYRVLETSHPPVYYLPPEDVQQQYLMAVERSTFCEWKGAARYFDITVGDRTAASAAWCYPTPTERFQAIAGYLAVYPSRMDACYVDGEQVPGQAGVLYGRLSTSEIVGPF
jgi:uncharacterized protein (DUF427 family)